MRVKRPREARTAEKWSVANVVLHPALADRLAAYLDVASRLAKEGCERVTSPELADRMGSNPVQVRGDLGTIHLAGTRGVGYGTGELVGAARGALGLREGCGLVLVGAGRLGRDIVTSDLLRDGGFVVRDVFDDEPGKIGRTLGGTTVRHLDELKGSTAACGDAVGIVATPANAAQGAAELLAASGVRTILSYSDAPLRAPDEVRVCRAEPALQLLHTLHYLTRPVARCAPRRGFPWTAVASDLPGRGAPWDA